MHLNELDTPALILRKDIFEKNLILMRDLALAKGKKLRPHAKTHKCPEIAKRQVQTGNCAGVCAAKLGEAEKLVEAGINSVLITSPVASQVKCNRLAKLNSIAQDLMVVIDSKESALLAEAAASASGRALKVLVDIDPEMGRTGVSFDEAPAFAKYVESLPHLDLQGAQCYAGHLQHIDDADKRYGESTRLMRKGAAAFRAMRSCCGNCHVFTGSGTGTSAADLDIPELTDIQVGSYCVMDAEYMGACKEALPFRPALRMLSSVVSANHPGMATIDAGTKAIYVTPGAPPVRIQGDDIMEDWKYDWSFGDEHGRLLFPKELSLRPGDLVELVVSHCDPTINLADRLYVVEDDEVTAVWDIALRGCCQ